MSPRIKTLRADQYFRIVSVQLLVLKLSTQTVQYRLREDGLPVERLVKRSILNEAYWRACLFSQKHDHWRLRHWRAVLFTDECHYHVTPMKGM